MPIGSSFQIIDISQPVSSSTACFPGDVPFSRAMTLTYEGSKVVNLSAITLSPHVGTHADAPSHIKGDMSASNGMAGQLSLDAYVGPATVIDISDCRGPVTADHVKEALAKSPCPERLLIKTARRIRYDVFEDDYSYFSVECVQLAAKHGVRLVGIDTPSVDHVNSKSLDTHNALDAAGMLWLENLDLTAVEPGDYFLIALPLKLMEAEASPVRAVLLK